MRLIYKCLHCGQARAEELNTCLSPRNILDRAYNPSPDLWGEPIRLYGPHECGPGIVGVAQLVAARDD